MELRRAGAGDPILGSGIAALLAPLLEAGLPLPFELSFPIHSLRSPERAGPGSLVCAGPRTRLAVREGWSLPGPQRPALIVAETGVPLPAACPPILRVRSAHAALAALLEAWADRWEREAPFASGPENRVAPGARVEGCLEGGTEIGPGAYVAAGAFVGRGTRIGANAVIEAHARIGRDCVIQPGAVIGCAGFGFYARPSQAHPGAALTGPAPIAGDLLPMPHPAGVSIGDGCFIGANAVVAAGVLHPTSLGRGCKLDSHVQIAHNVVLGEGCLLASQSGVAGSTVAGDRLRLGGAASVDGHLRLGNDVTVAACSGVTKDWPDGSVVAGFPARPIAAWRKERIGRKP